MFSRMYIILDKSFGSVEGGGQRRMIGYKFSGNIGVGKSRMYFFNKTAARCTSPNFSSDTTWPV